MRPRAALRLAGVGYASRDARDPWIVRQGVRRGSSAGNGYVLAIAGLVGGLTGAGLGLLVAGAASAFAGGVYGTVLGCLIAVMALTDIPALAFLCGVLGYAANALAYFWWPH